MWAWILLLITVASSQIDATTTSHRPRRHQPARVARARARAAIDPAVLGAVALPLVGAPLAVAALLRAERAGLGGARSDPTDWSSTAWRWSGDGDVLFSDGPVRVLSHGNDEWRTLRLGSSVQSAAKVAAGGGVEATAPAYPYVKLIASLASALVLPPLPDRSTFARRLQGKGAPFPCCSPFRALFLGGGACSLPLLLETALTVEAGRLGRADELKVVEIDPRVAAAARTYFGACGSSGSAVQIEIGDAETAVRGFAGAGFDLIVIDIFGVDNAQPSSFVTSQAWLRHVRAALRGNGLVLANFHSGTAPARALLGEALSEYGAAFPASRAWRVREQPNVVIAAANGGATAELLSRAPPRSDEVERMAERAQAIAARAGWKFDARKLVLGPDR